MTLSSFGDSVACLVLMATGCVVSEINFGFIIYSGAKFGDGGECFSTQCFQVLLCADKLILAQDEECNSMLCC